MQELWKPIFIIIKEAIDNIPEIAKKTLTILGEHGWYISMEMPISVPHELSVKILSGEKNEVNELMCDFYEYHLNDIQQYINEAYPHRSKLLDSAFNAHRKGEYELSIPIFLSPVVFDLSEVRPIAIL